MNKKLQAYIKAASESCDDLKFLVDNLDLKIDVDYSKNSLEELEKLFWNYKEKQNFPVEFGNLEDFAYLICRYMGECIIKHTLAIWSESKENNFTKGQPCIKGYSKNPWDMIFPEQTANLFLANELPSFFVPGLKEKRLLAKRFEDAIKFNKKGK